MLNETQSTDLEKWLETIVHYRTLDGKSVVLFMPAVFLIKYLCLRNRNFNLWILFILYHIFQKLIMFCSR